MTTGVRGSTRLDPNSSEPPYRQLARLLATRIEAGEYRPGAALPSGTELAAEAGVSRVTVQNALKILKADGLVVGRQGSGVFVRMRLDGQTAMLQAMGAPGAVVVDLYGLTAGAMRREVRAVIDSMPEDAHGLAIRAVTPDDALGREAASLGKADVIDGGGAVAVDLVNLAHSAGVRAVAVEVFKARTAPSCAFSAVRTARSVLRGATGYDSTTGPSDVARDVARQAWFDQEWMALDALTRSELRE